MTNKKNKSIPVQSSCVDSLTYWKKFQTPKKQYNTTIPKKYLVYNTWTAGFNNKRMSFEIAAGLAFLTNRILVIPEAYIRPHFYHQSPIGDDDIIDIDDLGITTMSYPEFCKETGTPLIYLDNSRSGLYNYAPVLEKHDLYLMQDTRIDNNGVWYNPTSETMKDWRCVFGRSVLLLDSDINYLPSKYPAEDDKQPLFIEFDNTPSVVMLASAFGNFYFKIHTKFMHDLCQFVARHVHYKEDIVMEAVKCIDYIEQTHGKYYSAHLRIADEFDEQIGSMPVDKIKKTLVRHIPRDATIFIASDVKLKERKEFKFLYEMWNVVCFDDVKHNINQKYKNHSIFHVPIEQLICTHGITYIGSPRSTFSAYIHRLRGYMNSKDKRYIQTNGNILNNQLCERSWHNNGMNMWNREYDIAFSHLKYI